MITPAAPACISHLPSANAADVHGLPRKPTETIFRPLRPSFFQLRKFGHVLLNNSPSPVYHLPAANASDATDVRGG